MLAKSDMTYTRIVGPDVVEVRGMAYLILFFELIFSFEQVVHCFAVGERQVDVWLGGVVQVESGNQEEPLHYHIPNFGGPSGVRSQATAARCLWVEKRIW
jgi:hypothetical protein